MITISWDEWLDADAVQLADWVRNKEVSPAELAAQAKAAIVKLNPKINAVLDTFDDVISDPTKDGMSPEGDFHGVPMLYKNAVSGIKGRRSTWGAAFLANNHSSVDDPLVSNVRKAGFNLIGSTNLPTMGCAGVSDSVLHGITRNPWGLEYTPSGSSGGSAAAVASGMVPIASASDGGGSTRSPAGYTGLIGLKPTRGRLPMPYMANEYGIHFATEGVLTRSVRDTAAAFDCLAIHALGDSFIPIPEPEKPYAQAIKDTPDKLRIALCLDNCARQGDSDPEVVERMQSCAKLLENLGHSVELVSDDQLCDWDTLWQVTAVTWIGGARGWPALAEALGEPINEHNCESLFRYLIEASARFNIEDFEHARHANTVFTRQFGQLFEQFDLLLTPVEAVLAPKCGSDSLESPLHPVNNADEAVAFIDRMTDNGRYMIPANEAGFPSISVPAGLDTRDIPLGMQLSAAWCREDLLLQVASQLEQAKPEWYNQHPPVNCATVK